MIFRGGAPDGPSRRRRRQRARRRVRCCTLLLAAASCTGSDVVIILQKMRVGLRRLRDRCRRHAPGGGYRGATPRSDSSSICRRGARRDEGAPGHRSVAGEILLGHQLPRPGYRDHLCALRWLSALAALAAAAPPAGAQQVKELGMQAIGTAIRSGARSRWGLCRAGVPARRPDFRRPGARRVRRGGGLAGGAAGALPAGPHATRGSAVYAGRRRRRRGRPDGPRLPGAVAAGIESRPGAASGWFVEAGVGGGVRLSAGYRWRWFPDWWYLVR